MFILERLHWILSRRRVLSRQGGHAHWMSFACKNSTFAGNNVLGKKTRVFDSSVGRHTYVVGAAISSAKIGSFCSIGQNVAIGGLGSHPVDWISSHPVFYSTRAQSRDTFATVDLIQELRPTTVGSDVWIGASAMLLDGVTIGHGSVVGAGAVVTKDVAPYAIVGGVPAKMIRMRFSAEVIDELLDWQWWNLPREVLNELAAAFCARNEWHLEDIQLLRGKVRSL